MHELSRRNLLRGVAAAGAASALPSGSRAQQSDSTRAAAPSQEAIQRAIELAAEVAGQCDWSEEEEQDRARAVTAGFTDDEAICWLLTNRAAAKFLCLPELHPAERAEVRELVHQLQTRLLSRPTYRRYREATQGDVPR